jgi:septum formation protein
MGVHFDVIVPDVEEVGEGDPRDVVLANAGRKAAAALRVASPGSLVLGADTEVVLDGRTLGKAANRAGARDRLESLSGRRHAVLGGVVLLGGGTGGEPDTRSGVARSEVTFRALAPGVVEAYLDSGEWRDRAGAYAIQGLGSMLVERVEGDFSNVVGLPIRLLGELAPEVFAAAGGSAPEG